MNIINKIKGMLNTDKNAEKKIDYYEVVCIRRDYINKYSSVLVKDVDDNKNIIQEEIVAREIYDRFVKSDVWDEVYITGNSFGDICKFDVICVDKWMKKERD